MSKNFGIYFAAHDGSGVLHQFEPGDVVPDWLLDGVGEDCLQSDEVPVEVVAEVARDDAPDESADDVVADNVVPDEAPDFTGAKAARGKK